MFRGLGFRASCPPSSNLLSRIYSDYSGGPAFSVEFPIASAGRTPQSLQMLLSMQDGLERILIFGESTSTRIVISRLQELVYTKPGP